MQDPQDTIDGAELGKPLKYYRPLHRAAKKGDWKAAEEFLKRDPAAETADITGYGETVLHAAAWAGNVGFIKELLKILSPEALEKQIHNGLTALHIAAVVGDLEIVKALVQKNPHLTRNMQGARGQTPLLLASAFARKEVIHYLWSKTNDDHTRYPSTDSLTCMLAKSGCYDILVGLIKDYPSMATTSYDGENILSILAAKPVDFRSGSSLRLWEKWIYHLVPVELNDEARHIGEEVDPHNQIFDRQKNPKLVACFTVLSQMYNLFWTVLKHLIPRIKHIIEEKLKHKYVETLVHRVCKETDKDDEIEILRCFSKREIMHRAAAFGIVEIVTICLQYFPNLLWIKVEDKYIIHVAIEQRREKIVNFLYKESADKMLVTSLESQPSALHLAAKLAPPSQLESIPCSALQMQRELQWFEAVENFVQPIERVLKNSEGQTASELFDIEHKKLAKEAEQWMRETSNSCMLVSTLIATIAFAAAFTVPGGNNSDKGIPIFLNNASFMAFAISIALALFSSTTSILMFLSIVTARYSQRDFLIALPKRWVLGFGFLFIALVTMIVAFGSALQIMLSERWKWVYIPTMIWGAIPVAFFVLFQSTLFFQMSWSTFGPRIFYPQRIW